MSSGRECETTIVRQLIRRRMNVMGTGSKRRMCSLCRSREGAGISWTAEGEGVRIEVGVEVEVEVEVSGIIIVRIEQ